jgi:hypothetical protein
MRSARPGEAAPWTVIAENVEALEVVAAGDSAVRITLVARGHTLTQLIAFRNGEPSGAR